MWMRCICSKGPFFFVGKGFCHRDLIKSFLALVGIITTIKEIRAKKNKTRKKSTADHRVVGKNSHHVAASTLSFYASKSIKLPAISARALVKLGSFFRGILGSKLFTQSQLFVVKLRRLQ